MDWKALFRRIDRKSWFVCYNCLNNNGQVAENAVFYYAGPPEVEMGRAWFPCPRCADGNTRSFQQLKDEGSTPQLWGLERVARSHPRRRFEIKPPAEPRPSA